MKHPDYLMNPSDHRRNYHQENHLTWSSTLKPNTLFNQIIQHHIVCM